MPFPSLGDLPHLGIKLASCLLHWQVDFFSVSTTYILSGFPGSSVVKNLPTMQESQERQVQYLGQEDPLEEGMATHSSILAWRIPWIEEPGELQSQFSSVAQSCPTLCDPMNRSMPRVHSDSRPSSQ